MCYIVMKTRFYDKGDDNLKFIYHFSDKQIETEDEPVSHLKSLKLIDKVKIYDILYEVKSIEFNAIENKIDVYLEEDNF